MPLSSARLLIALLLHEQHRVEPAGVPVRYPFPPPTERHLLRAATAVAAGRSKGALRELRQSEHDPADPDHVAVHEALYLAALALDRNWSPDDAGLLRPSPATVGRSAAPSRTRDPAPSVSPADGPLTAWTAQAVVRQRHDLLAPTTAVICVLAAEVIPAIRMARARLLAASIPPAAGAGTEAPAAARRPLPPTARRLGASHSPTTGTRHRPAAAGEGRAHAVATRRGAAGTPSAGGTGADTTPWLNTLPMVLGWTGAAGLVRHTASAHGLHRTGPRARSRAGGFLPAILGWGFTVGRLSAGHPGSPPGDAAPAARSGDPRARPPAPRETAVTPGRQIAQPAEAPQGTEVIRGLPIPQDLTAQVDPPLPPHGPLPPDRPLPPDGSPLPGRPLSPDDSPTPDGPLLPDGPLPSDGPISPATEVAEVARDIAVAPDVKSPGSGTVPMSVAVGPDSPLTSNAAALPATDSAPARSDPADPTTPTGMAIPPGMAIPSGPTGPAVDVPTATGSPLPTDRPSPAPTPSPTRAPSPPPAPSPIPAPSPALTPVPTRTPAPGGLPRSAGTPRPADPAGLPLRVAALGGVALQGKAAVAGPAAPPGVVAQARPAMTAAVPDAGVEGSVLAAVDALTMADAFVARLAELPVHQASAYARILRADLLFRLGRAAEAGVALDVVETAGGADDATLAHAALVRGDWAGFPDGGAQTLGRRPDGSPIPSGRPAYLDRAEELWRRSLAAYGRIDSDAGRAAGLLRLAEAPTATGRPILRRARIDEAARRARAAGDDALTWTARVHSLIERARTGEASTTELRTMMTALAEWSRFDGSTSYGRGLSQLLAAATGGAVTVSTA